MSTASELWKKSYKRMHRDIFNYKMVKPVPSNWVEQTIYLTSDVSRFSGFYNYDLSPYAREVINRLDPSDPSRVIAVKKCAQSGFTQGVIIPGLCYIISENPSNTLFMAGDKELAKNSIRTRFDPVIGSSGLQHLIRPNVVRKKNQRTGDTDYSKEFAGGSIIVEGTQNADKMRQFSVKTVFADDWEAAPKADKKEGSVRKLIEGRQTSFGSLAKTYYISTPLVKQSSNIEEVYLLGDQRKWHWSCPHCEEMIPVEWRTPMLDEVLAKENEYGGIVYELDSKGRLVLGSVRYKCQCCGGEIKETEKYDLNLKGEWIATAEPKLKHYVSYELNALVIPPGFVGWEDLAQEWIEANPRDGKVDQDKLKAFLNIRLGQTWEEQGQSPKVHRLMQNTRQYLPGVIPDNTCHDDGNKAIVLLTLACDLNGIMEDGIEDVRLDWEVVAHTVTGATYSVDQGSIGTFKRDRDKTKAEKKADLDRKKWTYFHNQRNSVWPEFEKLVVKKWKCESGKERKVDITVIDSGFSTRLVMDFVEKFRHEPEIVVGVKGSPEIKFRRYTKDTPAIKRSREQDSLYILETNLIKDTLSTLMRLKVGSDGFQPDGFMNFPMQHNMKYQYKTYFSQYEGEKRTEEVDEGGNVIGYRWVKKTGQSQNHFWDCRIYGLAAVDIYLDMIKRSDSKLKNLTWSEFCYMITN